MNAFLGILIGLVVLGSVVVGSTALQLQASDPAGNALAEVFLVFSITALWVLNATVLVVAGTRPPRQTAPWAAINIATLVLFLAAASSQLASAYVLSHRNSTGALRLLVQLGVIAAPLAVAAHAAWRGLGAPIPAWIATWGVAAILIVCSLMPWPRVLQLQHPPKEASGPPVDALEFPALLVHDALGADIIQTPAGLDSMHTNYVVSRTTDPILIDSRFAMFALRDLKLRKGSLGLPARGQGLEPVTFRLLPWRPDGTPENALKVLLGVERFSADSEQDARIRSRLKEAVTLDQMIAVLRDR